MLLRFATETNEKNGGDQPNLLLPIWLTYSVSAHHLLFTTGLVDD
jgi:hypothetical protein